MEALTPGHLALLIVAFVLLIGYRKLPDAARSMGRSLRIFRSEMHEMTADDSSAAERRAAELEAQAEAAEARAAELRERARQSSGEREPER